MISNSEMLNKTELVLQAMVTTGNNFFFYVGSILEREEHCTVI